MDTLKTLAISENFDIVITDNGMIKVDDGTSAVRDRLLFEIASNNSWIFDSGLGINWVDEYGTGLLQTKNAEPAIVNALEKKINNISGVKEIKSITMSPKGQNGISLIIVVIAYNDEEIEIRSEVK